MSVTEVLELSGAVLGVALFFSKIRLKYRISCKVKSETIKGSM